MAIEQRPKAGSVELWGKHFPSPGNRKYSQWGRRMTGRFEEEQRSHEFFIAFSLSI